MFVLGLQLHIPSKDVRRMIFALLTRVDKKMIWMAHIRKREAEVSKDEDLCNECAREGNIEVLVWAHERGCTWNEKTFIEAARGGHMRVLHVLREGACPWNTRACSAAALKGHLQVLQWLRAQGCPWDHMSTELAARGGHVEVLEWALAHACLVYDKRPLLEEAAEQGHVLNNASICTGAARRGHLETLQWLRERACPWDCCTTSEAADNSHLEVLLWARANGCDMDKKTLACAKRKWPKEFELDPDPVLPVMYLLETRSPSHCLTQ